VNIVRLSARLFDDAPAAVSHRLLCWAGGRCSDSFKNSTVIVCLAWYCFVGLSGCVGPLNQRAVYEAKGTQIGVESDHTIDEHAIPPTLNSHPAQITADHMRTLLGSLEVSGWSGIIVGIFETPHPKPVFTGTELMNLAEPFSKAFREAGPRERVFFSLQNPNAGYETDRTAGSLFIRDGYLHVILHDHYGFQKADPGGGEQRDPRDMKGMKLWAMRPAQPASVPEDKEPRWSPFDKVHLSLNVRDVLTAFGGNRGPAKPQPAAAEPATVKPPLPVKEVTAPIPSPPTDLQQQVQDLDEANRRLRMQVEQQTTELDKLKEDLKRLRDDVKSAGKSSKPPPDKKPPRKQTTE
jgi:hypothetical protein